MRTELLDKILNQYSNYLQYADPKFTDPLMNRDEDPMDEVCEYDTVFDEDGIKVILEYEFGDVFITGLTEDEQKYIENKIA